MTAPRILAFSGSARKDSFNTSLIKVAATHAVAAGAVVTLINLRDFAMPLYDGDLEAEEGMPAGALALRELLLEHDGLLIASPEYNSSISPLLKNAIDWVSRPVGEQSGLLPYQNKVAALLSASPGALGGLRGLVHVRAILGNIGVLVLPDQLAVAKAGAAFDSEGELRDKTQDETVKRITTKLGNVIRKLNN